jgi:hypothetical protein
MVGSIDGREEDIVDRFETRMAGEGGPGIQVGERIGDRLAESVDEGIVFRVVLMDD